MGSKITDCEVADDTRPELDGTTAAMSDDIAKSRDYSVLAYIRSAASKVHDVAVEAVYGTLELFVDSKHELASANPNHTGGMPDTLHHLSLVNNDN